MNALERNIRPWRREIRTVRKKGLAGFLGGVDEESVLIAENIIEEQTAVFTLYAAELDENSIKGLTSEAAKRIKYERGSRCGEFHGPTPDINELFRSVK